jgi:hypothetical protein
MRVSCLSGMAGPEACRAVPHAFTFQQQRPARITTDN